MADIPRAYRGVAFVDGYVYVIGGFDGVSYFNTVRHFNVSSFEWVQVSQLLFDVKCNALLKLFYSKVLHIW